MQHHLRYGFFGLFMGFVIARIGFADFGEVHRLFTLVDLRMLIAFAGAVLFAMIGFMILESLLLMLMEILISQS